MLPARLDTDEVDPARQTAPVEHHPCDPAPPSVGEDGHLAPEHIVDREATCSPVGTCRPPSALRQAGWGMCSPPASTAPPSDLTPPPAARTNTLPLHRRPTPCPTVLRRAPPASRPPAAPPPRTRTARTPALPSAAAAPPPPTPRPRRARTRRPRPPPPRPRPREVGPDDGRVACCPGCAPGEDHGVPEEVLLRGRAADQRRLLAPRPVCARRAAEHVGRPAHVAEERGRHRADDGRRPPSASPGAPAPRRSRRPRRASAATSRASSAHAPSVVTVGVGGPGVAQRPLVLVGCADQRKRRPESATERAKSAAPGGGVKRASSDHSRWRVAGEDVGRPLGGGAAGPEGPGDRAVAGEGDRADEELVGAGVRDGDLGRLGPGGAALASERSNTYSALTPPPDILSPKRALTGRAPCRRHRSPAPLTDQRNQRS